jgi:hypothetical protein
VSEPPDVVLELAQLDRRGGRYAERCLEIASLSQGASEALPLPAVRVTVDDDVTAAAPVDARCARALKLHTDLL